MLDWGVIASPSFDAGAAGEMDEIAESFLESLSLAAQNRVHLCALYQSWVDRVWAFQAARITGRFTIASTADAAAARRACSGGVRADPEGDHEPPGTSGRGDADEPARRAEPGDPPSRRRACRCEGQDLNHGRHGTTRKKDDFNPVNQISHGLRFDRWAKVTRLNELRL